jgi:hypothetical protein
MNHLSKEKLIEFLYLLMRDAAPTGEIVRIVHMINVKSNAPVTFTSTELHSYAARLATEMLG